MRGRKPKPNALKLLAGNPGKRPIKEEIALPSELPECPDHLDDRAEREWDRITKLLANTGLIKQTDQAVLAAYCMCYSRWQDAESQLRKTGAVLKSPNGMPIQNPYLQIANKALAQLKQFMVELGFSPTSRARVHADPPKGADEDAAFLDRRA